MLTVECADLMDLKTELAGYLAEKLPAVPLIRKDDIVLDPLNEENNIAIEEAIKAVKVFLARENINDAIVYKVGEKIVVNTQSGRRLKVPKPSSGLLACPHCGLVTPYKEEMDNHIKIHYIF